ncbi:hypothetical protein TRFO_18472 [Tritrichomonas foetus]|uniref:Myb-like DNA-binding domain containing protein n=1 Tax=Tritrichomonas foetus TaxID=1144522 RepID=A0A1J4KKR4_9EUKA|nr:hypothetical protein TRFO_18472 [Tritrichomonas foetus]|eukprot:OHT11897.1 hypothetical protein TRFO_18472 [Tritrichomonas foetus]
MATSPLHEDAKPPRNVLDTTTNKVTQNESNKNLKIPPMPRSSLSRNPFTPEEDAQLIEIMTTKKFVNWEFVSSQMGNRSSRQCRERWINYLNPDIRVGPWTNNEDMLLIAKVNELGKFWAAISKFFNGRSENDVKNRWYSHVRHWTIEINGHFVLAPQIHFGINSSSNSCAVNGNNSNLDYFQNLVGVYVGNYCVHPPKQRNRTLKLPRVEASRILEKKRKQRAEHVQLFGKKSSQDQIDDQIVKENGNLDMRDADPDEYTPEDRKNENIQNYEPDPIIFDFIDKRIIDDAVDEATDSFQMLSQFGGFL